MQDLRVNINKKIKNFSPLKFHLNSPSKKNEINFNTNGEFVSLHRTEGTETKKFFINQNLIFPTILKDGTSAELGVHLNAGIYNINKYQNPKGRYEKNKNRINAYPIFH